MNLDNQVIDDGVNLQPVNEKSDFTSGKAFLLALATLALASCAPASAQLPNDAKPTCTVPSAEFAGWFSENSVEKNGAVKAADSLHFATGPSCNFYKWAEQMFFWLTSPTKDNERVFQSPDFYTVSRQPDESRILMRNTPGKIALRLRGSKPVDAGGQPGERFVLMATNNSLVYYITQVNEVYAYFVTGVKTGAIAPGPLVRVPIEQSELDGIVRFAATKGVTLNDPNALVVEVKSSWVEIKGGLDPSKYITMTATVPDYTPDATNTRWTPTPKGERQAQLGLVGMHVVGSAKANSQMIWATFEHIDNTPAATYSYINAHDNGVEVKPAPAKTWLFSAHNCTGADNKARMHARNAPYIDAVDNQTIGPSDTCRQHAWGSEPLDTDKNTQVISINKNVLGMLKDGDVRKNYLMIGAIWNLNVGNKRLANSTMETYDQDKNCFDCHKGNLADGKLSHIYKSLGPLSP